jgi:hypothetical protein
MLAMKKMDIFFLLNSFTFMNSSFGTHSVADCCGLTANDLKRKVRMLGDRTLLTATVSANISSFSFLPQLQSWS